MSIWRDDETLRIIQLNILNNNKKINENAKAANKQKNN